MFKLRIIYLLTFAVVSLSAQTEFITSWSTTGDDESITISINPDIGTAAVDYTVDWGDGMDLDKNLSTSISHQYDIPGTYVVKITGVFPGIVADVPAGNAAKLQSIDQWGTTKWYTMRLAFQNAINMVYTSTDKPNLFWTDDMTLMFGDCTSFDGEIDGWDVSQVQYMGGLFSGATMFNKKVSSWIMSNVTEISYMFSGAKAFNQPLNTWDVSSVIRMQDVFSGATSFNQPLDNWDICNVAITQSMFEDATAFNQPLDAWTPIALSNLRRMFKDASSFNQSLADWDISSFDDIEELLDNTALSIDNYDATLEGWSQVSGLPTELTLGAMGLTYCDPSARAYLVRTARWIIVGDALCPQPFITKWSSLGNSTTITIPVNTDFSYNYSIDWENDGIIDATNLTAGVTHTYPSTGEYEVAIRGDFPAPAFSLLDGFDNLKLVDIKQWGDIEWSSMKRAFTNLPMLELSATDKPDLSNVSDLNAMFAGCSLFNSDINHWDVSNVTDMSSMFAVATSFNQPLNNWITTEVIYMTAMFLRSSSFNRPLDNWNTNKVTDMDLMFQHASSFNQDISNWNTAMVSSWRFMLYDAAAFDQSLDGFEISSATDMTGMLSLSGMSQSNYDATLIGWELQPMTPSGLTLGADGLAYCEGETARRTLTDDHGWNIPDDRFGCPVSDAFITTWRTTQDNEEITILTNSNYTYSFIIDWENDGVIDATNVTGDISHTYPTAGDYQVAIYRSFPHFRSASSISYSNRNEQLISIDQWGSIVWESMNHSFSNSSLLTYAATDQPDLSMVNNFESMFEQCRSFNGEIGDWDVSSATSMAWMFSDASDFNQDIDNWDVKRVKNISSMFDGATSFNKPLDSWETDSIINMSSVFLNAISFDQPLNLWNTEMVTDMSSMFESTTVFNRPISTWNTAQVTTMQSMFDGAEAFNQPLNTWNTSSVTNMRGMFINALAFNGDITGAINGWNTENVTDMRSMFSNAASFNQPLNDWATQDVTNMSYMFQGAINFNGGLISTPNGWNTMNVTDMSSMFHGAVAFNQPLNSWNTSSAISMDYMFAGPEADEQIVDNDPNDVQLKNNTSSMTMIFNRPLDLWDVSNVENMFNMFASCGSFDQSLASWNILSVTDMDAMLDNSGLSQANYDATLTAWSTQNVSDDVGLGAQGLEYCSSSGARQSLIADHGWEITGDYECGSLPLCSAYIRNFNTGPATNNNWGTTAHWSEGRIPDVCDDVEIDGFKEMVKEVTMGADGSCATLEVSVGVSFTVDGYTLTVQRPLLENGGNDKKNQ